MQFAAMFRVTEVGIVIGYKNKLTVGGGGLNNFPDYAVVYAGVLRLFCWGFILCNALPRRRFSSRPILRQPFPELFQETFGIRPVLKTLPQDHRHS
jgi:hypothetical protein